MQNLRTLWFWFFLFSCMSRTSTSLDSIEPNQNITDGETLISHRGTFELGFFSPGHSKNRYLGIWYYKKSPLTVVWVANRETPLNTTSGVLKLSDQGLLVLFNSMNSGTVWSSNKSSTVEHPIAQLLDSGNFVVNDGYYIQNESYVWQSFDYPTDTLLPGMKIGWNLMTGQERYLQSWKSTDDPGNGDYFYRIDRRGFPQAVLLRRSTIYGRLGTWIGSFSSSIVHSPKRAVTELVLNEKEIYVHFQVQNPSIFHRFVVTSSNISQVLYWVSNTSSWEPLYSASPCDYYGRCGANTICNASSSHHCQCLDESFAHMNRSKGCVRSIPLTCKKDKFRKYMGMVLPDTSSSWYNETVKPQQCEDLCKQNCNCTAYANLNIIGQGSGCLHWFHDLIDLRQYAYAQGGQDIYIRYPVSKQDHNEINESNKRNIAIIIPVSIMSVMLIVLGLALCLWAKKLEMAGMTEFYQSRQSYKDDLDLPTFDLAVIAQATNNFSDTNKLGEGGFGPVYKGTLADGQEIAVKRLSKNSGQGSKEFKNEVALIVKLQHRNLVKLLGYCIQGEEKMLIYEYMTNKSLDYFIFDENRRKLLDWSKRFNIIDGIARGLVYLHQDSRLRIIHRDLKASNILLDENMNQKISDFGLARTLCEDQVDANTNKVVGTYGYMPPEYAVHGHFSMKFDVFSFGVIILELISGEKNRGFSDPAHSLNLLGHAWRLWIEGKPTRLMDTFLGERCSSAEGIRCIHVGLLCVQQRPEDRPDMSAVVLMLNGEKMLPEPKAPGFYTGKEEDSLSKRFKQFSNNDVSLTSLEPR